MINYLNKKFRKNQSVLGKYESETLFWKEELARYIQWYDGETAKMYDTSSPSAEERIKNRVKSHAAILTWHKKHQEPKYLHDLQLDENTFAGKKILDIGSGPIPSSTCFKDAEVYCLDPLVDKYLSVGYPIHYYNNTKFIQGYSEDIPAENGFFDAVISVNALDHVDDFEQTAKEILRVLAPHGMVHFHLHYHEATQNEPLELNDKRVSDAFKSLLNFRKIYESRDKFGYICDPGESYTLWTNA